MPLIPDEENSISECLKYVNKISRSYWLQFNLDPEETESLGDQVLSECLSKFNPEINPDFIPYFKSIFIFSVKNLARSFRKTKTVSIEDVPEQRIPKYSDVCREKISAIKTAMRSLSDSEKIVISMIYYDGFSQKDISAMMSKTEARISQIHCEAINKMKMKVDLNYINYKIERNN